MAQDTARTIMVVDDHELVRDLVVSIVRGAGYETIQAETGSEAIASFEAYTGPLACVLLDLSLPDISGAQTLERLREIDGDVPVVLISAHDESVGEQAIQGRQGVVYLRKPFRPAALIETIEQLLDQDS